jgi:muramoyltetrapeptide carboxypeptidase LdcA involved in peptidoglycan recycling
MHMAMFDSSALCRIDHTIARSKCKNEQQSITTRHKMEQKKTTTPQALRKGDTIAFISPSSRLNTLFGTRVTRAKQFLQHHGFNVKIIYTDNLPSNHLQTIRQRCCEIHSAFSDVQVKAIICTIGGLSANELLPHLDYDLIRENPKIFVGYSDITLLHHALVTQCGLRTFYGPAVIPEFGEVPAPLEFTANHFFQTLMEPTDRREVPRSETHTMEFKNWLAEEKDQEARELIQAPGWKWLRGGNSGGQVDGWMLAFCCSIVWD